MTDIKICNDTNRSIPTDIVVCDNNEPKLPSDIKVCDEVRCVSDIGSISGDTTPPVGSTNYTVSGGIAPYRWVASGGGGGYSISGSGQTGTLTVGGDGCGSVTITVTDNCLNKANTQVLLPGGVWVLDSIEVEIGGSDPIVEPHPDCSVCTNYDTYSGLTWYSGTNQWVEAGVCYNLAGCSEFGCSCVEDSTAPISPCAGFPNDNPCAHIRVRNVWECI